MLELTLALALAAPQSVPRHLAPAVPEAAIGTAGSPGRLDRSRIPAPVRHAGIYHIATGTWTRGTSDTAAIGPDVVYSNTSLTGYFSSTGGAGGQFPGATNFDEGSIPGTGNPGPFGSAPDRDEYLVNCVTIAYCDMGAPASGGWLIQFYNDYQPCSYDPAPDDSLLTAGLPAGGGCWIVDLDITGSEACLLGDGDGIWDDDANLDSFGWSFTYAGTDGAPGNGAGFLLAADPASTDPTYVPGGFPLDGVGTYYGVPGCAGGGTTGYKTQNLWWIEDFAVPANSGCYWFGAYGNGGPCDPASMNGPYASFWIELAADTGACSICLTTCGPIYCNSNPNSTGQTATIILSGSQVAADDNLTLTALLMPQQSFGFFIVSETQGFVANPAGSQGNLCVLGQIGRFIAPGQIKNSGNTGQISLSTTLGEFSLTSLPLPMGTRAAMTGTQDNFQAWFRDTVGGQATSNFTDGATVTWL